MNARRAEILNRIKEKGLIVKHIFGIYGPERDDYISRSKLVMNIHFYESQIQEIIRLFYLASNSIPILSENNSTTKQEAQWCDAIPSATYHNLVDECFHMIHSETQLCTIGADIHSRISEFPQRIFTEKALEATFK